MPRHLLFLPFALLLQTVPLFAEEKAEEGFTPLFNGRDLAGWVNVNGAPETWTVREDGVIVCTGKPVCALRTERQYENFILEAEWRHLRSGGNAGIFIWASALAAPGQPFLRAIEVQVLDHGYGNTEHYTTVFPIHGSTMRPFGRHNGMRSFPSENRSRPSPEWNHYRVEAKDGVLRLRVNGKEVSGGENCVWRKGHIGLESEGAPVEWRGVRLKELPGSGASPEQSAPEEKGYRPLYNGVDLRGWKAADDGWQAADWKLERKGGDDATADLWTEAEFGDCEIIADCRRPERAAAGEGAATPRILLRGEGSRGIVVPLEDLAPGEWRRVFITVRGREVMVRGGGRDERKLSLPETAAARGPAGLTGDKGTEFANLYVRELKTE